MINTRSPLSAFSFVPYFSRFFPRSTHSVPLLIHFHFPTAIHSSMLYPLQPIRRETRPVGMESTWSAYEEPVIPPFLQIETPPPMPRLRFICILIGCVMSATGVRLGDWMQWLPRAGSGPSSWLLGFQLGRIPAQFSLAIHLNEHGWVISSDFITHFVESEKSRTWSKRAFP